MEFYFFSVESSSVEAKDIRFFLSLTLMEPVVKLMA